MSTSFKKVRSDGELLSDGILACLANETRREILSILQNHSEPLTTTKLATFVAATRTDAELVDVTRKERDRMHTRLVHAHLPKLHEEGLIDWDMAGETVSATAHPVLEIDQLQQLMAVEAHDWGVVLEALSAPRRRLALAVLEAADELHRRELTRRVIAREETSDPEAVSAETTEEALISFHHTHLPVLQHAGLIAYDGETVRYAGHPDLDPDWFDLELTDQLDTATTNTQEPAEIRTITGTGDIVARGQELFEQADEELFLMVTTEGLLEDGCIARLQDAIDRGVAVYVGSQTAAVRDLVREELPGATIWEPQLDWLNLPPNYERLGRLVFADREAVMLGTLGEPEAGGYRETAITGEGQDNSLVVLLRELLGRRLDHLDAQSADFRSQIPL